MLLDALDGVVISSAERSGTPIEQEDTRFSRAETILELGLVTVARRPAVAVQARGLS